METLKNLLLQSKKVTVREYTSQSTGEIRLYIQAHFAKGEKEASFPSTDETNKMIDDYLMGKEI